MSFFRISPQDAASLMADGAAVVVDIRDEQSFAAGRVPGARHLSNATLTRMLAEVEDETPVLVFCYHGISSQPAAQYLVSQGYTRVYSVDGGFEAWKTRFPDAIERD